MAHDVFVSHSAKDKTVSDALVAKLEAQGIRCWVAPRDVVPGADWGESIIDAIESSRIMVLIFSASANGSPQIKREIERAVDKGVYTIPFRIEDVQPTKALEYFISSAHWLDAFSQPLAEHLESLARTIKAILATPRPGSATEIAAPVTGQLEHTPLSVSDANRSQSPPPEQGRLSAAPPPLSEVQTPSSPSAQPAAPQRPGNTMWLSVIVGIIALLVIAGVVVYLLRPSPPAKPNEVALASPSPVSSPPAKPNDVALASPSPVSPPPAPATPSPSKQKTTSPAPSSTTSLSSPPPASPEVPDDPGLKALLDLKRTVIPAVKSADGIPSGDELKTLVLDSLLLFNDAVQTKSFKAFHAKLGTAWKEDTTPGKLKDIYHEFLDRHVDIADIAEVDPTFDDAPALNEEGWLVVKGSYALKGSDALFTVKYEKEQESWNLVYLAIETKRRRP